MITPIRQPISIHKNGHPAIVEKADLTFWREEGRGWWGGGGALCVFERQKRKTVWNEAGKAARTNLCMIRKLTTQAGL